MKAKEVMTPHVISVKPDSTVAEVATVLLDNAISAVLVIDDGKLVGLVSEGDLIRRAEIGTAERPRSWWLRLFTDNDTLAAEYIKTHATRVRDVMTRNVITVAEEAPLTEVAAILEKNHIKRVPVVRDGKPVGIISRANLVQALAAAPSATPLMPDVDDAELRKKVLATLHAEHWSSVGAVNVTVREGVVEYWGRYRSEEERDASRIAAEGIPGVKRVVDYRVPVMAYHRLPPGRGRGPDSGSSE